MHDATDGGNTKSSKTANGTTRVILLVESSYSQLPWAQQCQKTIASIIDFLERSAGQGCIITYAAAHADVPVTSSGWVRDMPALRQLAEGIRFMGSGQSAACGTALTEALAEAIYTSHVPAPNSPPPAAAGDVGRKGKPAIHTHLVLLPSTTPPSLAPLPWPVHDQTTAARAASGYYDGVHTTLQALQSWSSSSGSSGGGSSKYDEVPAATLMHERDTAHALPGTVDVADLLLSLVHYGLSFSQYLPLAYSSKVTHSATVPYLLAHATDALYLGSAMKMVVPLNEGMLLLSPFAAPILGHQVWPQEVAAVLRKRKAAAATAAAAAEGASSQRSAKQQHTAGPPAGGQQVAGGASAAPAIGQAAPRQSTPPPPSAAAAAAVAAATGRGSTPPTMLPPGVPAASTGMVAGPVGVHGSTRLSPPPAAVAAAAAAAGGMALQAQGAVAVGPPVQQVPPWAPSAGGAQLLQHAGNGLGAAAVSLAHPQQLGGAAGLPGGDPFAVDAAAAAAAAAAARAISPASVSPPPGLLGMAAGTAAGPSSASASAAAAAAGGGGGDLVGAGSGAAAAGSSLIHFPYVAWRGTIGFTRNGSAVGLFEAELCVQQAGWASSAFWSGLPLVLVCSKFLKTTQLWQALREHKARGHRLVGLRYQATKLLPAVHSMEASIRKEENSMVALAGSLGSGVSLYVCMGAEYKPKPGSTGAFNLASNMVILIMPSSEGSSAAAGAGAAVQQQG